MKLEINITEGEWTWTTRKEMDAPTKKEMLRELEVMAGYLTRELVGLRAFKPRTEVKDEVR